MIHFKLICHEAHEFDGWFRNNADFEKQQKTNFLTCPTCGSGKIEKMLMTPAVTGTKKRFSMGLNEKQRTMLENIQNFTRQMRANADYVGDQFSEEARKIHFGETKPRTIYGEASNEEVESLLNDGIDIIPLPELPEDKN